MRDTAYDRGVKSALTEAGYASLDEFIKHGSNLVNALNQIPHEEFLQNIDAMREDMPEMVNRIKKLDATAQQEISQELANLRPMGGGLLDKIRGVFSHEPHIPEMAQHFLNDATHGQDVMERLQPGSRPGEFTVKRIEATNIPTHSSAAIHLNEDLLHGPEAQQAMANLRQGMVPAWAGSGGLLGAAAGAGIGHYTTPDDADPSEQKRRMIMGGTLGAGAGALGGGLLGYLRGGALGRATIAGKDLAEQAGHAFGR